MYKKIKNVDGTIINNIIIRKSDNAFIPLDNANTDYQEYLQWLDDGNTPEEAQ